MHCDKCDETFWVVDDAGTARRCKCWLERMATRRMRAADIPRKHQESTLDSFDGQVHRTATNAAAIAQMFVSSWPRERGLLFSGPPGTGKTHLAVAVLRELIAHHDVFGFFTSWGALLERIRDTYDDGQQTSWEVMAPLLRAHVLVLDELAANRVTPWAHDTLTYLLGQRYDENRVTIITTNYTGEDLTERVGIRLRSRISEMCEHVEITGYDYRIRRAS